jgi:hypothetical protein
MPDSAKNLTNRVFLLGPQRFEPTLRAALDSRDVDGPVAVISAGWQEREGEDGELREHLGCELRNLRLYERAETILRDDTELATALRERQERLHRLQDLYRLRLDHALEPARTLMRRAGSDRLLDEHRRAAIRALRTLDRQHLTRLRAIHIEFARRWQTAERGVVAEQRNEIATELADCRALLIAGGHVAVLLNRLRLFDPIALLEDRPLLAWSAGAMALAERVVLFHDSPPQGAGNPEVLDAGLGVVRGIVPLPDASRRLQIDDPVRVSLFARRFSPATCVMLDARAQVTWGGKGWIALDGARRLSRRGALTRMAQR